MSNDSAYGSDHPGPIGSLRQVNEASQIAQNIRNSLENLSLVERRIARVLLADFPSAGLSSVQNLAELSEASAPSVIRFVRHLGYEGFADFQQSLREELSNCAHWPLHRIAGKNMGDNTSKALHVSLESIMGALNYSLDNIPEYDIKRAFELLSSTNLRVIMGGGSLSQPLADYFCRNLHQIRPHVSLLPEAPAQRIPFVADASKKDLYIIFDFRRYQQDLQDFCRDVTRRGAALILITDTRLSPIAQCANVVLPFISDLDWPPFSYSAAFASTEMLTAMVMDYLGDESIQRRKHWNVAYDVFEGTV